MQNVLSRPQSVQAEVHVQSLFAKWAALQNKNVPASVLLALEICKRLQKEKSYAVLEMFLNALPENEMYSKNERIIRAKISVAFEKKHFPLVYDLIKSNKFQHGEDLINIWDGAHYAEEFERTKKPLTALSRFRIRERFLPPKSICPERERRRLGLQQSSKHILQQWLDENKGDPYPSKETKEYLSKKANITTEQVKTWFANARRRLARMQGKEKRRLSWQRYQRRRENKECKETVSSTSLEDDAMSDGECKIIEESSGPKEDSVFVQNEDHDSVIDEIDMTVSMSYDCEVTSRPSLPFISSFTSPCIFEGNGDIRSVCKSPPEYSTRGQVSKCLTYAPPLEMVHPLVIVNPSLYGPTPLTYFYDYYSYFPVNDPRFSMCSLNSPLINLHGHFQEFKENSQNISDTPLCQLCPISPVLSAAPQPKPSFTYKDDEYVTKLDKTCPSSTLGICRLIPYGSPGQMMRSNAASALLDLSLKPRMPGI